MYDDRSGGYNRSVTNGHTIPDEDPRTNPDVVAYGYFPPLGKQTPVGKRDAALASQREKYRVSADVVSRMLAGTADKIGADGAKRSYIGLADTTILPDIAESTDGGIFDVRIRINDDMLGSSHVVERSIAPKNCTCPERNVIHPNV